MCGGCGATLHGKPDSEVAGPSNRYDAGLDSQDRAIDRRSTERIQSAGGRNASDGWIPEFERASGNAV